MSRDGTIRSGGRWAPEAALSILAILVFLGNLGTVDLWGKREQRAAAEILDTVQAGHWLVAEIQGRPRLEKPPLPRWGTAGLILLTGHSEEWLLRLPGALAALGTVGLVVRLGRRMGGRDVGLAAGLTLTSSMFFIAEMRQAGNDALLTFFTTLALDAAWTGLKGTSDARADAAVPRRGPRWMYVALGLGFLCKGPVVLLIVGLTLGFDLARAREVRPGVRRLWDPIGLVLLLVLALSWPAAVALADSHALWVWWLEMGQKTGVAGVGHGSPRELLVTSWPGMTAPWSVVATWAALEPLVRRGRGWKMSRGHGFVWSWAVANLAMFCLWRVAKPNYFLPCLPGVALLVGFQWVALARRARGWDRPGLRARLLLQAHWVLLFVTAAVLPVVASQVAPHFLVWAVVLEAGTLAAVVSSVYLWRRGSNAGFLLPVVAALVGLVLIGYGVVAPIENSTRGHRELARALERVLPEQTRTVMFFHELDEGLWYYLRGRRLVPVPGSIPRYNDGADWLKDPRRLQALAKNPNLRLDEQGQVMRAWLDRSSIGSDFVLIRGSLHDRLAPVLAGRARVVFREHDVKRHELVLLQRGEPSAATLAANASSRSLAR